MCGIVGYVGLREAGPLLLEGLQRLEYRGYDSAGIAVVTPNSGIAIRKCTGKLENLIGCLQGSDMPPGVTGIGHTRWATHGEPSDVNAHPHMDCLGEVVVIHNGIVENYRELKRQLQEEGHTFVSQTDTEVLPHLLERFLAQGCNLETAMRRMMPYIKGAHAILAMDQREPGKIVAARIGNAGGVVLGCGEGEMFVSSDLPAILPYTRRMIFLHDSEMAVVTPQGATCYRSDGTLVEREPQIVPYDPIAAAKGGYKHFMLKEIMEQSRSVTDTIRGRVALDPPDVLLEEFPFTDEECRSFQRIVAVACGTSWHAALVGKFMIEELCRIPVEVDYGSEFRYRDPLLDRDELLISVSQSGETVDTLAAMEVARTRGVKQLTICNNVGSQSTRVADGVIYTHAGPEIGVASTKAFTSQLVAFYLLALYLGRARGTVDSQRMKQLVDDLVRLPHLVGDLLESDGQYDALAQQFFKRSDFLYLARGVNYPIALEGALKLKEISYIHAEGYPAGEMKHGPIALIDERMPVVAIVLKDRNYEKMLSNVEQVKARGGVVIALATEGDREMQAKADYCLSIPEVSYLLSPVLTVIPLQLLSYHISLRKGCDVDQPRNLAKSVTVE
ncbi:MAG: glutamine--fructose-6-phosphate transaminase (isomerizing) [Dehalococcoidia bacterium]|nr:glutamine--fructose-6-phosphate transaminase (isomerizing) [Dehalococcoidia bacterium]